MKKGILVVLLGVAVGWGAKELYDQLLAMTGLAPATAGAKRVEEFRDSMRREASLAAISPAARAVGLPRQRGESEAPSAPGSNGASYFPIQTSREAADVFLSEHRSRWNVQEYHTLKPTVYESPLGTKIKYAVYQDDVPVIGLSIELEVGREKQVSATENSYVPVKKVDLSQPYLSSEEALTRNAGRFALDDKSTDGVSRVLYMVPGSDEPELSYVIPVKEIGTKQGVSVILRASDGQLLGKQAGRSEF